MDERDWLADRFEENRPHLRAVAYRVLGSASEADDAVQETWLRLSRSGAGGVENLGGGLTPAERLAFVLHDMFAVPFEEIAPIVERSPAATRQLASRARRRVQEARSGDPDAERQPGEISRRREVVAAFLAASREGDFDALLAMLDPDIVLRADAAAAQMGVDSEVSGAPAVAGTFSGRAKALRPALIDGAPGAVWTHRGETRVVFAFTISNDMITAIEQVADPERIARLEVVPLKAGLRPA